MAIGDISAITPIIATPGTTATAVLTTPANEEWTIRFARGVCLIATGGTAPTLSAGISSACNELCFNEVIPIASASTAGAKNILGPDTMTVPPSTPIFLRASTANAVRVTMTGTRKQVA